MASVRGKILRIALALTVVGVIAAIVAAIFMAKPMIRRYATEQARAHGFDLEIGQLDWGFFWVELRDSKFSLIGVQGIRGEAPRIRIEVSGLSPKRIAAENLNVQVHGSIGLVAVELSEWTKSYPQAYRLPAEAKDVTVSWRAADGGKPWLAIEHGTLTPVASGGGTFRAPGTSVAGFPVGAIGAAWTAAESTVTLGFGETDAERAPIKVRVNHRSDPPSADVTLLQTDIRRLAEPLGVEIPLEDVSVSAEARILFERGKTDGVISGSFSSRLHGFVPPHPPELDGFVFGDLTTFDSKFTLNEDRTLLTLAESAVSAGAFKLKGGGKVVRHPDHAKIDLDLRGSLPCDALAGAATESRLGELLGKTIGKMAGQAAKNMIGGSVAVRVRIDADSRELPAAKVVPTIGIGCGLKPLKLDIDLGKLPPLPSGFPALPSGFPPPPPIPTFDFPDP